MAATTESVKADAAEAPLLNKRNLILRYAFVFRILFLGTLVLKAYTDGQLVLIHSHLSLKLTG